MAVGTPIAIRIMLLILLGLIDMIDHKTKEQCRKILTYGMCLDMVQASALSTKKQDILTPRNVNTIYKHFVTAVTQRMGK